MKNQSSINVYLIWLILILFPFELMGQNKIDQIKYGYTLDKNKVGENIDKSNIIETTLLYLKANEKDLKIDANSLILRKSFTSLRKYYLSFGQVYKSIPVCGSHVGLKIKENGEILLLSTKYYQKIGVNTKPNISKEGAIQIAKNIFQDCTDSDVLAEELNIFPIDDKSNYEYKLSWRIELFSMKAAKGELFFIDCKDGSILRRIETTRNTIGGMVEGDIWEEGYFDT